MKTKEQIEERFKRLQKEIDKLEEREADGMSIIYRTIMADTLKWVLGDIE